MINNAIEVREYRGNSWYWPKQDGIDENSCWDYLTKRSEVPDRISELVSNRQVAVQAGGNCGYYVKPYARNFQTVYTFEPDPTNFLCLCMNVPEINVIKMQGCLSNKHTLLGIENHKLGQDVGAGHVVSGGVFPSFRIDDLALEECNLIHLDIEGFELQALRGAVDTLEKFKPVVVVEIFEDWANRYGSSFIKLKSFLFSYNYELKTQIDGDIVFKHKQG